MDDPKRKLSTEEIHDAGLVGWARIMGLLKARYTTKDFATGLELVNRIGAAAEEMDHHPDITLTYSDVVVSLVSHDVGGITSRDIRLARTISEYAQEMGIEADVAGLTQADFGLDTAHGEKLAPFYAALLGSQLVNGEPVDPSGQVPTVWWQGPDESGDGGAPLPPQDHEQRWHIDVWVAAETARARLDAVLAAGGTLVSDAAAPAYWVVEDADGNRHCICTPEAR